jgi:hypothetical protein
MKERIEGMGEPARPLSPSRKGIFSKEKQQVGARFDDLSAAGHLWR